MAAYTILHEPKIISQKKSALIISTYQFRFLYCFRANTNFNMVSSSHTMVIVSLLKDGLNQFFLKKTSSTGRKAISGQ
jgi:hypothetical protein